MAFQFRRGTEAQRASTGVTPASGELIHCTDSKAWYGGDGVTAGGRAMPAAVGRQAVAAPTADGVLAFDAATQRWATGLSLADLADVTGPAFHSDRVIWDAGEGLYRSGLPNPAHRPVIVAAQNAALPTSARPGTLWTRGPLSDGLFFCTAAGPPATWVQIAFAPRSGFHVSLAVTFTAGAAISGLNGFSLQATITLAPGAASAEASASGISQVITITLASGAPAADAAASGSTNSVTASFAAGAASNLPTDPSFSNVQLLLHMEGANNSTIFTDSSANNYTITAVGGAKISTAQFPFGTSSGFFDGTDDRLDCPTLITCTGAYTVEAFVRASSLGYRGIFSGRGYTDGVVLRINPSGQLEYLNQGLSTYTGSSGVTLDTWIHVALTRNDSNVVKAWAGGTEVLSVNSQVLSHAFIQIGYGGSGAEYWSGYIRDARITRGVCRYIANFTPPSAPFPDS